jgi:cell filamentation protein
MSNRFEADPEREFEPGSRGRVLRNLLGIRNVREMEHAESEALVTTQNALLDRFTISHRFTATDIRAIHRQWLGGIYPWAGEYRDVNISKGGFLFAAAARIPQLMTVFERNFLTKETPCSGMTQHRLATALARTHAELVLIHPFRDGNGRCSRLLAYLMAIQAGLPSLHFSRFAGRGKAAYFAAIQSALSSDYAPLETLFAKSIERTVASYQQAP